MSQQARDATSKVHPDLQKERENANFNTLELAHLLSGGKEEYEKRQKIFNFIANDPILQNIPEYYGMSREEQMEYLFKKVHRFGQLEKELGVGLNYQDFPYLMMASNGGPAGGIHFLMFRVTVMNLGDDEQLKYWMPLIESFKLLGCYAQTEMGHGSYVQGLETTATLDQLTDEFVINSPAISSMKFWPGELAKCSTHAVVHAQMIIDGKKHGIQTFICQLRSLEDHSVLPGLEIGDIGPKMGYNSKDNGYMILKNYRIPRRNLLMKYINVDKDGYVKKLGNPTLAYSTVLYMRLVLVTEACRELSKALTIAIRYGIVRRQFTTLGNSKQERQIMNYQTHMYRLIPLLANTFAMFFMQRKVREDFVDMGDRIKKGDMSTIKDLHTLTSGFKAFYTWTTLEGLETCRQTCGGHGFLMYSGIPSLVLDYSPSVTFDGDNTVMAQQSARFLIKSMVSLMKGKKPTGHGSYLADVQTLVALQCKAQQAKDFSDNDLVLEAMKVRAANYILKTSMKLSDTSDGKRFEDRWNEDCQVDLVSMTRAHLMYVTMMNFKDGIETANIDESTKVNLRLLCNIYGCHDLVDDAATLYEIGYFTKDHLTHVKRNLEEKLVEIRPQILPLVECWSHTDNMLNSAIGRYDGNVYETLYDWSKNKNPLNKHKVIPGFEEYMRPLLRGKL